MIKKILFCLNPETAHHVSLSAIQIAYRLRLTTIFCKKNISPVEVMGLHFPNRVGLAAGMDKNGDYIDALASLGFGFIEVGTITPKPQSGNSKPRLFRLTKEDAIINRMGFNNKGVDHLVERLQKKKFKGILGVNIGKNRDTLLENAIDDYVYSFRRVLPYACYVVINISSPNTPGLRELQFGNFLQNLLRALKKEQTLFQHAEKKYVPLVVKISPDLTHDEIETMAKIFLEEKIDGIIATNTTISREGVEDSPLAKEIGGLSGKPLCARSTNIIKQFYALLQNNIPIIASGGVMDEESAKEKLSAGAQLVQIYSGLIFRGIKIINNIVTL